MNFRTGTAGFILCLGSLSVIHAQEVLVPAIPNIPNAGSRKSTGVDKIPDTLDLPFFDDFSRKGWLPHPEFWVDEYAYINNSYTVNPITLGVATLDAIYSDGQLNGSTSEPLSSESDFLTSAHINLDFPGRQDIWLSFFYEPRGLGDSPETQDSLLVEFLAPDSSDWETVWSTVGFHSDSLPEKDTFLQVFIPINEERFLKKGFRFRFKNFASLPSDKSKRSYWSNVDHWHLDYVYLDTARSSNILAVNDVSMISSLGSLLKNYESMPWRHFFPKAYLQELKQTVDISYRNNDTTIRNATRILKITDLMFDFSDSVNGGSINVDPRELKTFRFPYNYPFIPYNPDSAIFEVMSYLITEDLDYKWNDTVVRHQKFYNYYSYDDGSAEVGYGLSGEGTASASVAYRFKTYKQDTLRGVKFYFNRTLGDYSQDYFRLAVWDHDAVTDRPGELIRSVSGVKPEYQSELNRFTTYAFDTTIIVSDIFYVGWIKTTENMLNVGWDRGNNNQNKIFYNLGQEWYNTKFEGSLMLRPLMGPELVWPVSAPEIPEQPAISLHVYPNPAGDQFYIELSDNTLPMRNPDPSDWSVNLYNLQGKLVYSSNISDMPHYIGDLPEGLYIVKVNQDGLYRASSKLMIAR